MKGSGEWQKQSRRSGQGSDVFLDSSSSYLSRILRHFPLDRVQTHPHARKCEREKLDGSIYRIWREPLHKDHTIQSFRLLLTARFPRAADSSTDSAGFCRCEARFDTNSTWADSSFIPEDWSKTWCSRMEDKHRSHLQIWSERSQEMNQMRQFFRTLADTSVLFWLIWIFCLYFEFVLVILWVLPLY